MTSSTAGSTWLAAEVGIFAHLLHGLTERAHDGLRYRYRDSGRSAPTPALALVAAARAARPSWAGVCR